jgi:hypothetical protein
MKKSEFIEYLKTCPGGDLEVLFSSDEEGNDFHTASTQYGIEKTEKGKRVLILYPAHDYVDLE